MCNLPFVFFSDSKLTPILIGTLLAICYGNEINRDVVQQQLSMEILLTFLKSSKTGLFHSSNSTHFPKAKEETKISTGKTITNDVKKIKNEDEQVFDNHRSMQRLSLPKTLFSPSKSIMAKEKLGMFAPNPSTPKGIRLGNITYCSTIQNPVMKPPHFLCSRMCKSLDFNDGTSSHMNSGFIDDVVRKNIKSLRSLSKNLEVSDEARIVVMNPLPIAFELRNRFPEGLWPYAEDFFSSNTWMGQLVKCL